MSLIRTLLYLSVTLTFLNYLIRRLLRMQIGKRVRPALGTRDGEKIWPASNGTTSDASLLHHERRGGLLDRWYYNQPEGEKRGFIQSITLTNGTVPTLTQLQHAVSRVALRHPVLIQLPAPSRDRTASQVTQYDVRKEDGRIVWPLECVVKTCREIILPASKEAVQKVKDNLYDELLNQKSEPELTSEEYDRRHERKSTWSGLRVILMKESENSSNSGSKGTFTLVIRLAHLIGDGMSGVALLRHIITELSVLTKATDSSSSTNKQLPSSISPSELMSISAYPSQDDLVDYRPRLSDVLEFLWTSKTAKWRAKPNEWWSGKSLANDASVDDKTVLGRTEYQHMHFPASTVSSLTSAAKYYSCTLHGLLNLAAAFTTAVVSREEVCTLKVVTPFSTRGLQKESVKQELANGAKSLTPHSRSYLTQLNVDHLIMNAVSIDTTELVLHGQTRAMTKDSEQRLFHLAYSYLTKMKTNLLSSFEHMGMMNMINLRDFVLNQTKNEWRRRVGSVLVSNLGSVDATDNAVLSKEWQREVGYMIENIEFLQPSHYQQSVFVNNVISSSTGGLTNIVVYSTNVVEREEDARRYKEVFEYIIQKIASRHGGNLTYEEVWGEFNGTSKKEKKKD